LKRYLTGVALNINPFLGWRLSWALAGIEEIE
jgi:hypothetical protein